jgi:chemotaxis regulatin CheY-phosphate phosphatase CheZ
MKKCWDKDPLKRPPSEEVLNIIEKWIKPSNNKIEDINEELKCNIMEFINAPIEHNNFDTESHSQAYYTSRMFDFTSKELNEILESEDFQVYHTSTGTTKDLEDCVIKDVK